MEFLGILLGVIGNFLCVLGFASPYSTFWQILKKRSTESFSAFPYECTLLSNMIWLYYGILNPSGLLLVTITSVGCAFEVFYLSLYLVFATKAQRISVTQHLSIILLAYLCIMAFTMTFSHGNSRLRIVGILGAINSICMYASPLSIVRLVMTTKSVEYMPFLLSLSMFLNGGVWMGYGIVLKDLFVGVPNGVGLLLGFIQLSLYAFYKSYIEREGTNPKGRRKNSGLSSSSCDNDEREAGGDDQSKVIHCCKLEKVVDVELGHIEIDPQDRDHDRETQASN